jgi:chromosome segregation ATPase
MAREKTVAGKLGNLARFTAALGANAADLAYLDGARTRLEAMFTEAQEIAKQQAAFAASKQEASKRLASLLNESARLANGLRKLLTENYGVRSEKLAEFGLQPFRGRKARTLKRSKKADRVENPEPSTQPAAPLDTNS